MVFNKVRAKFIPRVTDVEYMKKFGTNERSKIIFTKKISVIHCGSYKKR